MIGALVARLYPACAGSGTQGLPIPDPVNIARLAGDRPSPAALAAPADFEIPADVLSPPLACDAETLFAALLAVGTTAPRTWLAAAYPTRLQAHFVARTARLNFPELIVAEARAAGRGSVAVIYSASLYNRPGMAAHHRRLQDWLGALDAQIHKSPQGNN
jgi:hypothetical protein